MKLFTLVGLALVGLLALGECRYSPENSSLDQGDEMWISAIEHGTSSFHSNPSDYRVYRNVKDFGCIGDGIADDTACINTAISSGARCGINCGSSTTLPALIYFPSGTYKISSPIIMYYYSQLIGNAKNRPTIIADPNFDGMAMLEANPYDNTGREWYTPQNNFFRQLRNFNIDTTGTPMERETIALRWRVSQATSLFNVHFKMPVGSNHRGVFIEDGSGGFMSDLSFEGGLIGLHIGNQQFLSVRISFNNVDTAVKLIWNWQWTFKSLDIKNCRVGLDMSEDNNDPRFRGSIGSALLMDSVITDSNTAVLIHSAPLPTADDTTGSLVLDNVQLINTPTAVGAASGDVILIGGTTTVIGFQRGSKYTPNSNGPAYVMEPFTVNKDSSLLDGTGKFFEKARPQYEQLSVDDFASVKAGGARGDGRTDDSDAIQNVINANVNGKVVYFPAGTYLIGKTVKVPPGTRMIGEIWSTLMASGDVFQDSNSPVPMLQVGEPGQTGSVEITDFMFSTRGAQPGAVLVQWNLKASSPGAAMMHDAHFRVGGFAGSELQVQKCPKGQGAVPQCMAAHTLLHITPTGSAYMENVWAWTGDHDLDNHVAQGQISIYTGRGVLVESREGPTWLYGIQSEHNVFYQYQVNNARNVFITMIQSENPYWQPGPPAPEPFSASQALDDPDYAHCNGRPQCRLAYALIIKQSQNVYLYGAGMYQFFYDYDTTCVALNNCQDSMVNVENNSNTYMFNINTKAAVNMVVRDNNIPLARNADNMNTFCQTISAFLMEA